MGGNEMIEKTVAKGLLGCKAVTLSAKEPYTWASGLKSPIYCDNRITLSYPKLRSTIAQGLAALIKTQYPEAVAIVGVATGGLPQAALVADILNLPLAYVRPKAKDHGRAKMIEGFLEEGSKVVMIEDLISTGGSVLNAVEAVRTEGMDVLAVAAVFTYQLDKATINFAKHNVELKVLSNYSALVEVAVEENYITKEEQELLKTWRLDPENYTVG
jgi:orotate phosphoribosyltransferase